MIVKNQDYEENDVVQFIREEMERISTQYPIVRDSILSDAQAFQIWFLHQETGIEYAEAAKHILDGTNDCGVDFIWVDSDNREVFVGQCEYSTKWTKTQANERKAIETFRKFRHYLNTAVLPEELPESSQYFWRLAKKKANEGYILDYIYVTPKYFSKIQEDRICEKSGISNYFFLTHDIIVERGYEFLDGQTGMCNFKIKCSTKPTKIPYEFGIVYVFATPVKEIYNIVEGHRQKRRLRALFASNVRTYLSRKKRSKEIGDAMQRKLENAPQEFLICNNGITIQCSKIIPEGKSLKLSRASISNGCQTAMNIHTFFEKYEGANPAAEVMITIIELKKDSSRLSGEIARSRNFQNPVNNRDLMSNNFRLVCLHHRLLGDRISGSEKRYYLLRKQGEKQTLLKEKPQVKGQFMWIDADDLARCIAAVIRQNPTISRQGTNDLFGKHFNYIFPDVADPTHTRCKYSWWLTKLLDCSYDPKAKWKGKKDSLIYYERDFKSHSYWAVLALIARKLKDSFNFDESMEKRFVEKAENWYFRYKKSKSAQEFEEIVFHLIDNAYSLLHIISKTLLGKKLPRAREPYTSYQDMFKGPVYDTVVTELKKGLMKTYQYKLKRAMKGLYDYLRSS